MNKIGLIISICGIWIVFLNDELKGQAIYDPVVELIEDGFGFTEGPVWKDGLGLLFSDIPQNKIYLWNPGSSSEEYLSPSGNSNGLALDEENNLIMCQHGDRAVSKYVEGEGMVPLATHYQDKKLNSPNDLAIKSDGSIFFTDPPFGINESQKELDFSGIYRLSPSGDLQLLDGTLNYPNGIAFSPDESKLYVSESDVADVYVWDVVDDTILANKSLFYDIPGQWADGMKLDAEGYLYVTGPVGLWIFAPDGELILSKRIHPSKNSTNCNWGPDGDTILYITADTRLYKVTNKAEEEPDAIHDIVVEPSKEFVLYAPQPNPVSNETMVPFRLERDGRIQLTVMDQNGREVYTLTDKVYSGGTHNLMWNTTGLPSGVYFIVMHSDQFSEIQRCIKLEGNEG